MGYSISALTGKIMEMYPEIEKNGIHMGLVFNAEKETYFVSFRKGRSVFATHLQKNEADACMDGVKFIFLGSQIGRWMKNFITDQTQTTDLSISQSTAHWHHREPGREKEEQWAIR